MDLATIWFALVVLCWVLFAVLEGFDFGVGVLAGVLGRDDHERGAAIRTVGPVWDGNEVWLVAAIGVTFAAFPTWYAALLSGLYLPLVGLLLALAARGVALEFRGKVDSVAWRRRADVVLGLRHCCAPRGSARSWRWRRRVSRSARAGPWRATGSAARWLRWGPRRPSSGRWSGCSRRCCRVRRSSGCARRARCGSGRAGSRWSWRGRSP